MNRFKYLELLSSKISDKLPADEYNNAMQYYTEYFQDAGEENEEKVIAELGNPEELANKIIAEYMGKSVEQVEAEQQIKPKKGLSVGWVIFIAIIGSPLWIALFGIAIGLAATIFAVAISFAAAAFGGILGGIVTFVVGIITLFDTMSVGVFVMGCGLLFVAAGIAFLMLTLLAIRFIKWLFGKISPTKRRRA